jgi:hypothetical protein
MNKRFAFLLLTVALALLLTAAVSCVKRGPESGLGQPPPAPTKAPAPAPAPIAPPPATSANPELKVLKVSGAGAGQTGIFVVKLQWNGDKPTDWTIKKWTMMRDKTDQTQSMLVIEDQSFPVKPGEPTVATVRAIPINPTKEPPRNLIVEYAGMPVYELTDKIEDPKVRALQGAIEKVNQAFVQMMPLVRIVGDSVQYAPKDRAKVEPYLSIALWDLSGAKPRPYIEPTVLEGAFVVAFSGGMTQRGLASFIQKKSAGITERNAIQEAARIAGPINRLLDIAGLDARLTK